MKTIIEHHVLYFNETQYTEALWQLNRLFSIIAGAHDQHDLKVAMEFCKLSDDFSQFEYGYGSNHMWFTQKNLLFRRLCHNRLLIVEF